MVIIGICGGSGSGKSTVSACLGSSGGLVFDTDAIYHRLIEAPSPCVDALAEAFGKEILSDGAVDRAVLRKIVFADEKKRLLLNQISHPFVTQVLEQDLFQAEQSGCPFAVIDAPLLLEAGLDDWCDFLIAVIADKSLRVQRIMERDGITEDAALERISRQIPDEELFRRCDAVIRNNASLEDLQEQCRDLLQVMGLCDKKE